MTGLEIVSVTEWSEAQAALKVREKELTRELDALAAQRRRLPATRIDKAYVFQGPDGPATLADLFEGRRQLIVYTYMWHGDGEFCSGCAMFTDNVGHLAHLYARDTSMALVSRAPLDEGTAFKERMGWTIPWYSSADNEFGRDLGHGDGFGLDVFVRNGDDVLRTYTTSGRGVERLGSVWTFLDLTPYGRQETWEDSPDGWPQTEPYQWWRLHNEYDEYDENKENDR